MGSHFDLAWQQGARLSCSDDRLARLLGLFYAVFTGFLGFVPNSDEWKVMGLAPYGKPGVDLSMFLDVRICSLQNPCASAPWRRQQSLIPVGLRRSAPPVSRKESDINDLHKDIALRGAGSVRSCHDQRRPIRAGKNRRKNLCLAGGVALNSKANGKIVAVGPRRRIFSFSLLLPMMESLSALRLLLISTVGSACPSSPCVTRISVPHSMTRPSGRSQNLQNSRVALSDPAATAAEFLSQGKILGWFQGRMEFGPRALGNRSILADPRDPEMNIKVNNAVKFREWWRPFAPSFKKEAAPEFLESAYDSPFIMVTAQVRPEKRGVIPSVTHVDGSARPQTVEQEINPLYWRADR